MTKRLLTILAVAATLAACSSVPERNSDLDRARGRLNEAQRNTQTVTLAPEELKQAGTSMEQAQRAFDAAQPKPTVDHLAYLTSQRVVIANETATSRASQAVTESASAERDKLRLSMRTAEADRAKAQLAMSEQNSALKSAALVQADAAAQQDQARIAASNARVEASNARVEASNARARALEMQLNELNAKKTERGYIVTLGDVLFDTGRDRLKPAAAANLGRLAEAFKRDSTLKATIEGYTDSTGSAALNEDLSDRRARAVVSELLSRGVLAEQLSQRGFGAANPVASNDTAAGRQMNRRVEVVFAQDGANTVVK